MAKKAEVISEQAKVTNLQDKLQFERERHLETLEDYWRVVDHFISVAHFAEGGYDPDGDYNTVLGIALRASWSLPLRVDTTRSMKERSE